MYRIVIATAVSIFMLACGPGQPDSNTGADAAAAGQGSQGNGGGGAVDIADGDFGVKAGDAKSAHGETASKLRSTKTEAVLKLIVQNDKAEPIPGVVVKVEGPSGEKFYTNEADSTGYAETLIPVGKKYKLTYLSLFKDKVEKWVTIPDEPNVTMKLTLTYTPLKPEPIAAGPDTGTLVETPPDAEPSLILTGVVFDTAKATLKPESFPHLEGVVEFMTYKPSAIIELSGHTDNQGKPKKNQKLSEKRAMAVREYLISKGIEGDRIIAVGYGQDHPIATNETEEGRALNRRTEAKEIGE